MNSSLLALISAASALIGVLVGGWLTSRNQRRERQIRLFREQLGEFYGPMLAMRAEVLAKAELQLKISGKAGAAWQELIGEARRRGGVEEIREARRASFPIFEEIIEYNNRQLAEEIIPIYRKILQLFIEKFHLADISTIGHLEEVIVFVEIWNRSLAESLPSEVLHRLDHSEEKLFPFYDDLASRFELLQEEVRETRRWRSPKVARTIKVTPSR